jgi:hypothetical protein
MAGTVKLLEQEQEQEQQQQQAQAPVASIYLLVGLRTFLDD